MPTPPEPAAALSRELAHPPRRALAAVAGAAEAWGAEWQQDSAGGRLTLPIAAGIRHGLAIGRLAVEPSATAAGGSRLRWQLEESRYVVQTAPVAILVFAAAGGLLTVLWPFFPGLLPAAPLGAVIALSGWFLVISRLRTSGPEEFFDLVAEMAGEDAEPGATEPPTTGGPS